MNPYNKYMSRIKCVEQMDMFIVHLPGLLEVNVSE